MKNYITRYQPNKGYIPTDKLRLGGHSFEKFSFTHLPTINKVWHEVLNGYTKDIYHNTPDYYHGNIERVIKMFIEHCEEQGHTVSKVGKYFYFNFNHDGICVFINRGL